MNMHKLIHSLIRMYDDGLMKVIVKKNTETVCGFYA